LAKAGRLARAEESGITPRPNEKFSFDPQPKLGHRSFGDKEKANGGLSPKTKSHAERGSSAGSKNVVSSFVLLFSLALRANV
jgi:hypothetical protein